MTATERKLIGVILDGNEPCDHCAYYDCKIKDCPYCKENADGEVELPPKSVCQNGILEWAQK